TTRCPPATPPFPYTTLFRSRFCVLSRLKPHENSNVYSKMRVYDGESLKDTDPRAKSAQEYRDAAGVDEGMDGISTRFAFKVLSGDRKSTRLNSSHGSISSAV